MSLIRGTVLEFTSKHHEHDDIYSFHFKPTKPLKHKAGQHGLFSLKGFLGIKAFSLTSSPEDNEVIITTHVRQQSRFKQLLDALQPGDTVKMRGPIMNFVLKPDEREVVFLAQGIGITPYRSLLRHIRNQKLSVHSTLLHVSSSEHTFKAETSRLATKAIYAVNSQEFRQVLDVILMDHSQATYYISGGGQFLTSTVKQLKDKGIKGSSIRQDRFLGY